MPILGNHSIHAESHRLFVEGDFDATQVQQASYDLRLGEQIHLVGKTPDRLTDGKPYFSIAPGQFALLTCFERLTMPDDLFAFITLKSTYKMQGLINISGFHVDP